MKAAKNTQAAYGGLPLLYIRLALNFLYSL